MTLVHYDAKYDSTLRSSRDFKGRWNRWCYLQSSATRTATATPCISTARMTDHGTGTTTGSTTTVMPAILLSSSQLSSFLPRLLGGGVLFWELCWYLPLPSTEHFASFFQLERYCDVFFVVQWFGFPKYHEQQFRRVNFPYGNFHPWDFFFFL